MSDCGSCTACCRLMGIHELEKPVNEWCGHCKIGKGCGIYKTRPTSCQTFECMWLQWKKNPDSDTLPVELRPDKCHVMLVPAAGDASVSVHVDPDHPHAWATPNVQMLLLGVMQTYGIPVLITHGPGTQKILLQWNRLTGITQRIVNLTEPDETGKQELIYD